MSSSAKEATGSADSEEVDSNSVSSKPKEDDKKPRAKKKKGSDTSYTTNDPSSSSAMATVGTTVAASQPTSQPGLSTLATAAAAAAPPVSLSEKKPRRAGFREQFLQKLRVMLDRESQNDSAIVQWSTDGNSFIIVDQNQFEADTIPTYFEKPIFFASFLTKLYRWGFNRVSSKRDGRYEFCSPTFRRLSADGAPAAAVADTLSNAGGGASIQQVVQQQQHTQASSPLLQVMARTERSTALNPTSSQADANAAITALLSNIQRQCSNQQSSIPSQQSALSHPLNTNIILQQYQHSNPTQDLLNAALSILVGSQTPATQLTSYPPISQQRDAIEVLMSLHDMLSRAGAFQDTSITPDMSQPNNVSVQSLLTLLYQVGEDERLRRAQADAIRNATIATIGQILGVNSMDAAVATAQGQVLRSSGGTNTLNLHPRNPTGMTPTGMTIRVPHHIAAQTQQGIPPPSAGSLNFNANPIAAILHAARSEAGQLLTGDSRIQNGTYGVCEIDANDEGNDNPHERPLSTRKRKRKSPEDEGYSNDDNGPRKK